MAVRSRRDVAQLGSAPEWGSGGRRFESGRPDWGKDFPEVMYRSGGIYDPTLLIPLFACSAPAQGTVPPGRFDGATANTVRRDYKADASVMSQIEPGVIHALSLLNDWAQDRFLAAC